MAEELPITASTTDFLLNVGNAALQGSDNFILQLNGLSENGVPIAVPGLNSSYGLYIEGTVTVQGNPSVYGPGTVALVLDPTNNDGTPAATWDATTQTGSVGFSNLANTADDIVLATGSVIGGSFGTQSNGQPGVQLVESFKLNPAIFGPVLSQLSSSLNLEESLFNTATSRVSGPTNIGGTYITVNDGYGIVGLAQTGSSSSEGPSFLYPASAGGREHGLSASLSSIQDLFARAAAEHDLPASLLSALNLLPPEPPKPTGWNGFPDSSSHGASSSFLGPDRDHGWTHNEALRPGHGF
jgi:hypothetical protein